MSGKKMLMGVPRTAREGVIEVWKKNYIIRSFTICTQQILLRDHIKGFEMDWARSTYRQSIINCMLDRKREGKKDGTRDLSVH